MNVEIAAAEVRKLINEIREQLESLFNITRVNVHVSVGEYLSPFMGSELTHFLDRDRYERYEDKSNQRKGELNHTGYHRGMHYKNALR